jgi:microtubule-associated protein-like 6
MLISDVGMWMFLQVFGVEWNPYEVTHGCPQAFVTFGRKHIKLWTCDQASNFTSKQLSFGK